MKLTLAIIFTAIAVVAAAPQSPSPTGRKLTLSGQTISGYNVIQRDLLEAAELMPEADYLFKPTPETRPFGQLIAHVALAQFLSCSYLQGGPSPKAAEKEETPRSKAVLIALLKESTTFCNPLVNAMVLRQDGRPHAKLLDFGIAQLTSSDPDATRTGAGGVMGGSPPSGNCICPTSTQRSSRTEHESNPAPERTRVGCQNKRHFVDWTHGR